MIARFASFMRWVHWLTRLVAPLLLAACSSSPLAPPCPTVDLTTDYSVTWVRLDGTCDEPTELLGSDCSITLPDVGQCDTFVQFDCPGAFRGMVLVRAEPYGYSGEVWVFGGPLGHGCDSTFAVVGVKE